MSRPQKEGLDYFPHDTDAANDEKVEALQSLYQNDGYALYFKLLERIYRTPEGQLDISDAEIKQVLCNKLFLSVKRFDQIINTAVKVGCFDKAMFKKGVLTSDGIHKRRESVIKKRVKMQERYKHQVTQEVTDKVTSEVTFPSVSVSDSSSVKEGIVKGGNPFLKVRYDKSTQKWEGIDDAVLSVLKKLYPGVELEKQIEAAGRWIYGHDKQYKDMKRFLCNWMDNVVNERFQKSNNKSFKDSDIKIKEI